MIKRILEISSPSHIKVRNKQLLIDRESMPASTLPLEDLGVILLDNPQITVTQKVTEMCSENNIAIIHCDRKHLPVSMTLPVEAHTLHSKTIRIQAGLSPVRKKQLWQQIIKFKISEQAKTLDLFGRNSIPLRAMVRKVKSGDSSNMEAQAAQKYWPLLMGHTFRRDHNQAGLNGLLNYGYAIVRAMVARALAGTGFHLALGIKHSNQYNAYCLADDLMEPFRPWVDQIALRLKDEKTAPELDQESKARFLDLLSETVTLSKQKMPLMVACGILASDLKSAYTDKLMKLQFPERACD